MDDYKALKSATRTACGTEKNRDRENLVTSMKGIHLPRCGTLAATFLLFKPCVLLKARFLFSFPSLFFFLSERVIVLILTLARFEDCFL